MFKLVRCYRRFSCAVLCAPFIRDNNSPASTTKVQVIVEHNVCGLFATPNRMRMRMFGTGYRVHDAEHVHGDADAMRVSVSLKAQKLQTKN